MTCCEGVEIVESWKNSILVTLEDWWAGRRSLYLLPASESRLSPCLLLGGDCCRPKARSNSFVCSATQINHVCTKFRTQWHLVTCHLCSWGKHDFYSEFNCALIRTTLPILTWHAAQSTLQVYGNCSHYTAKVVRSQTQTLGKKASRIVRAMQAIRNCSVNRSYDNCLLAII